MLAKPARRGPRARRPIPRYSRIRTRRPLGTVRREAKAAGDLTPEQWEAIVRFYVGRCAYCETARATQQDHVHPLSRGGKHTASNAQQDHVHPLSRGGKHTASNVVPSCDRCNYAKGTSTRWEPRRRHPFMEPEVRS